MVMEYVQDRHRANIQNMANQDTGVDLVNKFSWNIIQMDDSGFPLAPWPSEWKKVTKLELEQVFTHLLFFSVFVEMD